jgi:hypothetical protein
MATPPRDLPGNGFLRQLLRNQSSPIDIPKFKKTIVISILELLLRDPDGAGSWIFHEQDVPTFDTSQLTKTLETLQGSLDLLAA